MEVLLIKSTLRTFRGMSEPTQLFRSIIVVGI